MKIKTTLAVLALMCAPSLATAMGCSIKHDQQAMTCAEGTTWDADSRSCKPMVSS